MLYFFVFSSFCSPLSCQYLLIAALALPVLVVGIQCNDGELFLDVVDGKECLTLESINELLIKEGHAVEYHGGTKTKVWGDY